MGGFFIFGFSGWKVSNLLKIELLFLKELCNYPHVHETFLAEWVKM